MRSCLRSALRGVPALALALLAGSASGQSLQAAPVADGGIDGRTPPNIEAVTTAGSDRREARGPACDFPAVTRLENEDCGESINDGCNLDIPAFDSIEPGDFIGGTFWRDATVDSRDTDWYQFDLDTPALISITVWSRVKAQVGFVYGECEDLSYDLPASIDCPVTYSICLLPGTYFAFVAPSRDLGDLPCDQADDASYVVNLEVDPAAFCPDLEDCAGGGLSVSPNSERGIRQGGISCRSNTTFFTFENQWAVSLNLSDGPAAGEDVAINCVEFGVFNSGSPVGGRLEFWIDTDGGAPQAPGLDLQLLGSREIVVDSGRIRRRRLALDEPIHVPSDSVLVVTLYVEASSDGFVSFAGNEAPGASATYLLASGGCDIETFVDLADIGWPDHHWVVELEVTLGSNLPPSPDLLVTEVVSPVQGAAGQRIEVEWTVENSGTVPAAGTWTDRVYLSTDAALSPDDVPIGSASFEGALRVGESYVRTQACELGGPGTYYFIVKADADNDLSEFGGEGNNDLAADQPIDVTLEQWPDLVVSGLVTPAEVLTGEPFEVRWTVANVGMGIAEAPWSDRVYVSANDVWDEDDAVAGTLAAPRSLEPGMSYERVMVIEAPVEAGTFFIFVQSDIDDQVEELLEEGNNLSGPSDPVLAIEPPRPNLGVQLTAFPSEGVPGAMVEVRWITANDGEARAEGTWIERLYAVPEDQTAEDLLLGEFSNDVALDPGSSVTRSLTVGVPAIPGGFAFRVCVDDDEAVSESSEVDNCDMAGDVTTVRSPDLVVASISVPTSGFTGETLEVTWSVRNDGDALAEIPWNDRVYVSADDVWDEGDPVAATVAAPAELPPGGSYQQSISIAAPDLPGTYHVFVRTDLNNQVDELAGEGNNLSGPSDSIVASDPPRPNLVVAAVAAPVVVDPGSTMELSWTTANVGEAVAEGSWTERVFAMPIEGGEEELLLGSFVHEGAIEPGLDAGRSVEVAAPAIAGGFRVQVCVDTSLAVVESDETDNCRLSDSMTSVRLPDLRIDSVIAPATATADEEVAITWIVGNLGDATATGAWVDVVRLSADQTPSPDDAILGSVLRSLPVGAAADYRVDATFGVPSLAEDVYYIVVETDALDAVLEGSEGNNDAGSETSTLVVQPPRPNLVPGSIDRPEDGLIGSTMTVTWQVANLSANPVSGAWTDRLIAINQETGVEYILGDAFFSEADVANGTYTGTVETSYPVDPGTYVLRLIVDRINSVNEGTEGGENDNVLESGPFIADTYEVTVATDLESAVAPATVSIYGQTLVKGTKKRVPELPVQVGVTVQGTTRTLQTVSDDDGWYAIQFESLANEAGVYTLSAGPPGTTLGTPVQDQFTLYGLLANPTSVSVAAVAGGAGYSSAFTVQNPGDTALSALEIEVDEVMDGVLLDIELPVSHLEPLQSVQIPFNVLALEGAEGQSVSDVRISAAEGPALDLRIEVDAVPPQPNLVAIPGNLTQTMPIPVGSTESIQTVATFMLKNTGAGIAEGVEVLLPPVSWMSLVTPMQVGDLLPGEAVEVSVLLSPPSDLPLGPYSGTLVANGVGVSVSIPFEFLAVSTEEGMLTIEVTDEFTYFDPATPRVAGAFVVVRDVFTGVPVAEVTTDSSGLVEIESLPEGYYEIIVVAPDHGAFNSTIYLPGGGMMLVTAFLPAQVVSYEWNVVPTDVADEYEIVVELDYETNVPAPVVTVEPPFIQLSEILGDQQFAQIDFTITNHGLVTADDVRFQLPDHPGFRIIPLVDQLGDLAGQTSIVVPVIIEDLEYGAFSGSPDCTLQFQFGILYDLYCNELRTYSVPVGVEVYGECPPATGHGGWDPDPDTDNGDQDQTTVYFPPAISQDIECNNCCQLPTESELCLPLGFGDFEEYLEEIVSVCTGGVVDSVEVDSEVRVCRRTCCTSACERARTYEASAEADIAISTVFGLSLAFAQELEFDVAVPGVPGTQEVDLEVELQFVAGLEINGGGQVSIQGTSGCEGGACVTGSGSLSAGGLFGVDSEFEAIVELSDVNGEPYYEAVTGVARGAYYTNLSLEVAYDSCADGWASPSVCFEGVYGLVEFEFSLFGQEFSFCRQVEVVPPQGACGPIGCDAEGAAFNGDPVPGLSEALEALSSGFENAFEDAIESLGGSDPDPASEGICASVSVQLSQSLVLTRSAFEATLVIRNEGDDLPLEEIFVDLNIADSGGAGAEALFGGVGTPVLIGIDGIDGDGSIPAGSFATVRWLLVPRADAAPEEVTPYFVGGLFSYVLDGEIATVPLYPTLIEVVPSPSLVLDYFIETRVYGDDPFTPDFVEPAVPFVLGLVIRNQGFGTARQMNISSGQPVIVENQQGLLVDFSLLGSQVDRDPVSPALSLNLGDVGPGESRFVQWLMAASLQGEFVDFSATYENVSELGEPGLSLIDSLEIHGTSHVVRVTSPEDDGLPDFLAFEDGSLDDLPDELHRSDSNGLVEPVSSVTDGRVELVPEETVANLTIEMPDGWTYIRVDHPYGNNLQLSRVLRADGSELLLGPNAWQTFRVIRPLGEPPYPERFVHLFDRGGSGTYRLEFSPDVDAPTVLAWRSLLDHGPVGPVGLPVPAGLPASEPRGEVSSLLVTFDEPVDAATATAASVSLEGLDIDGEPIDPDAFTRSLVLGAGALSATVGFDPPLPAGRYCIRLIGVADQAGNLLDGESSRLDLAVVPGDASGDLKVNATDGGGVASLVGTTEIDVDDVYEVRSDLDRDGDIDLDDVAIVTANRPSDLTGLVTTCLLLNGEAGGKSVPALAAWHEAGSLGLGTGLMGDSSEMVGSRPGGAEFGDKDDRESFEELVGTTADLSWDGIGGEAVSFPVLLERIAVRSVRAGVDTAATLASFGVSSSTIDMLSPDGWVWGRLPGHLATPEGHTALAARLAAQGVESSPVVAIGADRIMVARPAVLVAFDDAIPDRWRARVVGVVSPGASRVSTSQDGVEQVTLSSHSGGDAIADAGVYASRTEIWLAEPVWRLLQLPAGTVPEPPLSTSSRLWRSLRADLDLDGRVTGLDLELISEVILGERYEERFDLTGDGVVDMHDFVAVAEEVMP